MTSLQDVEVEVESKVEVDVEFEVRRGGRIEFHNQHVTVTSELTW